MKTVAKPHILLCLSALSGLAALLLRQWFLTAGTDEKGLLVQSHPGSILLWVLTAAVGVFLALTLRQAKQLPTPRRLHPAWLRALGEVLLAAGLGITAGHFLTTAGGAPYTGILCILAALCALACGGCYLKKLRPHFLLYMPVPVLMMLYLIDRYRPWSSVAESQYYLFQLLACVGAALASYHRVILEARRGQYGAYLTFSCITVYFSLAALPGSDHPWLLLGLAAWLVLDPGLPRQKRAPAQPAPEETQ